MSQASSLSTDHLLPRQPGGLAPGAALALAVHAGLLVALTSAVDWRLRTPDVTASAELWASVPQAAAPRPAEAPPTPTPVPAPAPVAAAPPPPPPPPPAPAPAPPPPAPAPPPPPVQAAPPRADADIALQLEKRRLAEDKRLADERLKLEKAKLEKVEKARLEREQAQLQLKEREAEAQRKKLADAEQQQKKRETQAREAQLEEARLAKQREENLKRMQVQAASSPAAMASPPTATGAATASGKAPSDAAPSANYTGKLVALIRSNIVFTGSVEANAAAEVEVRAGASGSIIARRLLKTSGQPDWDEAVLRAIDRTAKLPRDSDGSVPPVLIILFKPRE